MHKPSFRGSVRASSQHRGALLGHPVGFATKPPLASAGPWQGLAQKPKLIFEKPAQGGAPMQCGMEPPTLRQTRFGPQSPCAFELAVHTSYSPFITGFATQVVPSQIRLLVAQLSGQVPPQVSEPPHTLELHEGVQQDPPPHLPRPPLHEVVLPALVVAHEPSVPHRPITHSLPVAQCAAVVHSTHPLAPQCWPPLHNASLPSSV